MSVLKETPEQEIARLQREINDLLRYRNGLKAALLKPMADDALARIREAAIKAAVPSLAPAIPGEAPATGSQIIVETDEATLARARACVGQTRSETPAWFACSAFDLDGDGAVTQKDLDQLTRGVKSTVLSVVPQMSSPLEYVVFAYTADGRLVRVPLGQVQKAPIAAAAPGGPAAPGGILPGVHVRVKATGKTGYVSNVSDGQVTVGLDEGGFVTVPLEGLEPA